MADSNIDNLRFGLVLDSKNFEKEMKRIQSLAERFEKSVTDSLAVLRALNTEQGKGTQDASKKAQAQEQVVSLTRQELEAKRAAGTITTKELQQLRQLIALDKVKLEEQKKQIENENKKLENEKKQIELQNKKLENEKKLADIKNKQLENEKKLLDIQNKQLLLQQRQETAERAKNRTIALNTSEMLKQNGIFNGLGKMAAQYVSVLGAATVVRNLVRITGEFEAQHVALRAILQDVAAADNIYNQLQALAVKSPFTFHNLVSYAKQLTAFSIPVDEVYETTKKLADVSAGLGVDMGRIILAYGQVRSAEFLRGQEVRQFTEAGIPILQELAEQFEEIEGHAISVGEVFERISARQVPFEMVEEAFSRMTSAGGKFYNMQEVLAETVQGKVSNLQDAWQIMLSNIGNENSGLIKNTVSGITNLLSNYEKWIDILGALIKAIGLYSAGMLTLNTITRGANTLQAMKNALQLVQNSQLTMMNVLLPTNIALEKLNIRTHEEEVKVLKMLNAARKAAVGIVALVVACIWEAIQILRRSRKEANKTTTTINTAMAKLSATMMEFEIGMNRVNEAFVKMKSAEGDATEETEEFHDAVDALKRDFPKLVDDNIRLAQSVDELGKYWAAARQEMNQYYADEARNQLQTDLKTNRDESLEALSNKFTRKIKSWLPKEYKDFHGDNFANIFWQYVIGNFDYSSIASVLEEFSSFVKEKRIKNGVFGSDFVPMLNDFASQYDAIINTYNAGLKRIDDTLDLHSLNTTRKNFNDYIFSLTGGKQNMSFDKWLKDNDLAFLAEDTAETWAERQREKLKSDKVSDEIKSVIRQVFDQFKIVEDPNLVTGWQADVNKAIDNFGSALRSALAGRTDIPGGLEKFIAENSGYGGKYKVKDTDDLNTMVKQWRKDLEETEEAMKMVPKQYANLENDAYRAYWLDNQMMQAISMALYGVPDFNKASEKTGGRGKTTDPRIKLLSEQIKDLLELQKAYKDLSSNLEAAGMANDKETILDKLRGFFPAMNPEFFKDNNFYEQALPLIEQLRKLDKEAADALQERFGKDGVSVYNELIDAYVKAAAKAEQARAKVGAWIPKKAPGDQGAAFDIEDIVSDYEKSVAELEKKRDDAIDNLEKAIKAQNEQLEAARAAGRPTDDIELIDADKVREEIDLALDADKANEFAQSLEKIRKEAKDFLEESEGLNTFDFSNWGDKSVRELRQMLAALRAFDTSNIPDNIKEKLNSLSEDALPAFIKALEEIKEEYEEKGERAAFEEYIDIIIKAGNAVSSLTDSIQKYADAVGNAELSSAMEGLSDVWNIISSVLSRLAQGDTAGAVIAAVTGIMQKIFEAITEAARLREAIAEAAEEARTLRFEMQLASGVDTLFGENTLAAIRNVSAALAFLKKEYGEGTQDLGAFWYKAGLLGTRLKSISDFAKEVGLDMYDEYGNLNAELLEKILNTYEKFGYSSKAELEKALAYSQKYAEAMKQLEEVVSDTFGQLASNIADAMWSAYEETGSVAAGIDDAFSDLGASIVKSMMQSLIFDEVLQKYEDDLLGIYRSYSSGEMSESGMLAGIADMMTAMQSDLESSKDLYQAMMEWADSQGFVESGTGTSMSEGLKSLTEETGSLLASYVNAIRADVSVSRSQREAMLLEMRSLGFMLRSVPSIDEHLASIEAHTYDTAVSTRNILSELQRVITTEGGASAIRTYR